MSETLYLIDGHAQIFRAYFAIRGGMRSPVTGEPTHAIYGFTAMLLKLFSQLQPHYVIVAVDMPGKTFRDDLFSDYKGTRKATPDDLSAQFPRIFEVIDLFGIPIFGQPGLEADDIIASITDKVIQDPSCGDVNIRIVSKDKDLEQLLGDRVTMFDIHTDTTIDVAALMANKGIRPDQVIDVLALTGDTVDNVPGVEGIGPKTAAQLIHEFGSIDGIFENIEAIKGKRRENLEKGRDQLPLSRQLVTLHRTAEVPFSLEASRVRPIDLAKILPLFQELGFNHFQDEVRRLAESGAMPHARPVEPVEEAPEEPASAAMAYDPAAAHYSAITTPEQLNDLVKTLRQQKIISVDTETTGLKRDSVICGISLSWAPGSGVYIPILSPAPVEHLTHDQVFSALRPIFEDPSVPKCGHNLKFDAGMLLRSGVRLRGVVFDSMLAGFLLQRNAALDNLALSELNYKMIPITSLIGSGPDQVSMETIPVEQITPYAAEDADLALQLYDHLQPQIEAEGMSVLLRDVEAPLGPVLAEMEHNGILCDPDELQRQGEGLRERAAELRQQIQDRCGCEFHVDSTKQLAEVLFDKLGLASGRRTKTGRSTDVQVLEKLAAQEDAADPKTSVPRLIIEYRQLTKLISTYLGNLRDSIDPHTGRIHTTFHQLVAATGRLASTNPNLQNIPIRTDIGRQIRKAFPAAPGQLLICADYSQIELRLLAHLSEDPALVKAFDEDQDIHAAVAAQVFGTTLENVTREQRAQAKTINFGIIYGITAFGLSRRIEGMDVSAARQLIDEYRARFSGIDHFMQRCVHQAMECGYVSTILGRRRMIPEVRDRNANTRSLGERLAINSVVQGSAADLIKAAMVKVQNRIEDDRLPLRMLLQIHDELVMESPAELAEKHAAIVREEMAHALDDEIPMKVPLKAEAGIGPDWMSAK